MHEFIALNHHNVLCDNMAVADDSTLDFFQHFHEESFENRMNLHHTLRMIAD